MSEIYQNPERWLCHTDQPDSDNHCATDLSASIVAADATVTVEEHTPAADPPVDCFYVYPTTSPDETDFSDFEVDAEEPFIVINQAARLSSVCRVFAPVYRQVTVAGLLGNDIASIDWASPYADVLDAFRHYLDNDSEGRGFVLVGHSQGSRHLVELIRSEIENDPELAERMISAYLIGSTVEVAPGEDVGGTFASTPLCRADDQTGCVVTYATYRATDPPVSATSIFGEASDPAMEAGCVSPAALIGNGTELDAYFPTEVDGLFAAFVGSDGPFADPMMHDPIDTPFYTTPGLTTGECVDRDGHQFVEVTINADPMDPRVDDIKGDLTEGWGLHLVDVHLMMGDIVTLAGRQAAAWLAK